MRTKSILLIDSVGALISAISLGVLIPALHSYFDVPVSVLHVLGGIAAIFSIYSLISYSFSGDKWREFLKVIAVANLSYCVLTGWLILVCLQGVSVLAITYFIAEILLVVCLSLWEFKVAFQK